MKRFNHSAIMLFAILAACMLVRTGASAAADAELPAQQEGPVKPPPIRIAYFIPSDREPLKEYSERLDRVMTEVQRFYREGMEAQGYGPLTFELERDEEKRLRIYVVEAKHPMETYGRNASGAVRSEVKAALQAQGVNIDRETVVIFQLLLKWENGKAIEIGPYCGGGGHRYGTAWVYDDERLDAALLGSKKPGGYYNRPCSIGQFNTHYVGGVAHELGHAFGLPHVRQTAADNKRGNALMGAGNHSYGQEKRGQGPGTFLSAVSAMRLRYSRPFAGERADADAKPDSELRDLDAPFADGRIELTGTVVGRPPVWGLVAYNDLGRIPADYDAVGWTCKVADDGRFKLAIGEMRPGASQLRITACHANGATTTHAFDYVVTKEGVPEVGVFRYTLPLRQAVSAYLAGDRPKVEALAKDLKQRFADVEDVQQKAAHLLALLDPTPPQALAEIKPDVTSAAIPQLAFTHASVGWLKPMRDQVPEQCFLQVGGTFHTSGLYAHAPSRYALALGRNWKRLRAGYGLQDGSSGSVVFVVKGDGKALFRSQLVKDHVVRNLDVAVEHVDQLELAVENGGDDNRSDWGVWLSPQLER